MTSHPFNFIISFALLFSLLGSAVTVTPAQGGIKKTSTLIFVDAAIPDHDTLVQDIKDNVDGDSTTVIYLDPTKDGIVQITSYISNKKNISAIHIFSHGVTGSVQLGSQTLNEKNITRFKQSISVWNFSLIDSADIFLYGCDVAANQSGVNLLRQLSEITGADVAASDDTSGNMTDADWDMETQIGLIESASIFADNPPMAWQGILADVIHLYSGIATNQQAIPTSGNVAQEVQLTSTQTVDRVQVMLANNGTASTSIQMLIHQSSSVGPVMATATISTSSIGSSLGWVNFDIAPMTFNAYMVYWIEFRTNDGADNLVSIGYINSHVIAGDFLINNVDDSTRDMAIALIDAENRAPVIANPIPNQNISEDSAFNFQFAANTFSDIDNDALTYTAQLNGGGSLPAWLSFTPGTRTFGGTPTNADVGIISIDVTANDGNGGTVTDTFNITVTNTNDEPVVANPIPNQNATENTAFNFQFANNTFSDPDVGDTLTYSAQLNGGGALPGWLSFDAITRTFSGMPANGDVGTISIDVTADDANGGTVTDTFSIVVADSNLPPAVANPIPDQNAIEGSTFNFQFAINTFSDPNIGDVLAYSAQLNGGGTLPAWLSFDPVTRTFSGMPASNDVGTVSIDVIADDSNGGTETDTFNINVIGLNPRVTSVNVTSPDGTYSTGDTILVTVTFDQNVTVDTSGGTPTILLETGTIDRFASYVSGSGTSILTFNYTVQSGDSTSDLDYPTTNALALNGGTITSNISNPAILTLPAVGGVSSIAGQHAIVIDGVAFIVSANSLVASYTTGPITFTITFDDDAFDPTGDSDPDDVTNPDNYLLVEDGANGVFDTTSCLGGLTTDDTQINVSNVFYFSRTAVVSLGIVPPAGNYRLFVCGTTSIVDLAGNPLAGNGVTAGTDYIFNFVVGTTPPITPNTGIENLTASVLPKTGFAPNKITTLPAQPANLEYAKLGDLVLEIPSLNVKSTIVGVPQSADKTWDVTWLGDNTGWLNGTAFPTWNGNSVLTAHVTNASGVDGPFAALKSLKYGDQVIVHVGGVQYIYEVRETKLTRPYSTSYAFESKQDASYLTLITCSMYNPLNESYLFRRVVRAVLVEVK